jgi:hypothetical protein
MSRESEAPQKSTPDVSRPLYAWNTQPIESGLEVAPPSEYDLQFVNHVHEGDKEVINEGEKEVVAPPTYPSNGHIGTKSRKLCGIRRRWFLALLILALFLLALGVGLGVGLSLRKSQGNSNPTSTKPSTTSTSSIPSTTRSSDLLKIGGSLDASYYSSFGAWNGSASARALQNFAQDFEDAIPGIVYESVVYYQHHSGEIRWLRETANEMQRWQPGPSDLMVVASDARNSTPISTVHIFLDGISYWHLFCRFSLTHHYQKRRRSLLSLANKTVRRRVIQPTSSTLG